MTIDRVASLLSQGLRNNEARLLRLALGSVFVWFGALKLLGETSVLSIIQSSYPILARAPYLQTLGLVETILGLGVLLGWHVRTFAALIVIHLSGTLVVPFLAPSVVFDPSFPILTLQGEFVVKNLVLIIVAALLTVRD
jgi:uncharacterized membrane protein YkgB